MESCSREVVEKDFKTERQSGRLKFRSLSVEDAGNGALVDELGVSGSSLFVLVTGKGKRFHKQITDVWLYWDKPDECKRIIAEELSRYL